MKRATEWSESQRRSSAESVVSVECRGFEVLKASDSTSPHECQKKASVSDSSKFFEGSGGKSS